MRTKKKGGKKFEVAVQLALRHLVGLLYPIVLLERILHGLVRRWYAGGTRVAHGRCVRTFAGWGLGGLYGGTRGQYVHAGKKRKNKGYNLSFG